MTETGWRCPTCGRRFKRRTREHSCDVRTLDAHLGRASDTIKRTFAAIQTALRKIGPHNVVAVKTMIVIRADSNFAGITVKRDAIALEFLLAEAPHSVRIFKTTAMGPDRHSHHVRLTSPADVDAEVVGWLRAAYRLNTRNRAPAGIK